ALPLVLTPMYDRAVLQGDHAEQVREATLAAIALELFRRREGRLPGTLGELTPDLLPCVPVDRFDGLPLQYTVQDGRPVLYSVGNNYRDDGGVAPSEGSASAWVSRRRVAELEAADASGQHDDASSLAGTPAKGDWVLFPPARLVEPAP